LVSMTRRTSTSVLLEVPQPVQEKQLGGGNAACTQYYFHSPFGGWNGTPSLSALAWLEGKTEERTAL
ncbi:hypothetical protein Tco_0466928, partial [Tanacetum coccineum]